MLKLPLVLLGASLLLLLRGRGGRSQAQVRVLPVGLAPYSDLIDSAAASAGIPAWVLATFVRLESGGDPASYNPEKGAMRKWSETIATDSRWKANPDYANAVSVFNVIKSGTDPASIAARSPQNAPYASFAWKFGSFGLVQISAITARGAGYPFASSNEGLFDPETNLNLAAKIIAKLAQHKNVRAALGGRAPSSKADWAVVRAAYVGGPGAVGSSGVRADLHDTQSKFMSSVVV